MTNNDVHTDMIAHADINSRMHACMRACMQTYTRNACGHVCISACVDVCMHAHEDQNWAHALQVCVYVHAYVCVLAASMQKQ